MAPSLNLPKEVREPISSSLLMEAHIANRTACGMQSPMKI
jgi:hypothetical protein